ncbi:porin, partial [Micromonospora sp. STR1s_5]|nr:porin [Micromonospora sp. STR1s_5]
TAHGAGFFYIPGTDTCLRVGGRARFEYQYTQQNSRNSSVSGYRGLGRLNIDARTATPYGTLRAFVRFEIASRSGGYLKSGTQERMANAFFGTGQDTQTQLQKYVDVDKAFIQFAGLTAGRAQSFFDFYAGDLEIIGSSQSTPTCSPTRRPSALASRPRSRWKIRPTVGLRCTSTSPRAALVRRQVLFRSRSPA